jgi:hypothetical protein
MASASNATRCEADAPSPVPGRTHLASKVPDSPTRAPNLKSKAIIIFSRQGGEEERRGDKEELDSRVGGRSSVVPARSGSRHSNAPSSPAVRARPLLLLLLLLARRALAEADFSTAMVPAVDYSGRQV